MLQLQHQLNQRFPAKKHLARSAPAAVLPGMAGGRRLGCKRMSHHSRYIIHQSHCFWTGKLPSSLISAYSTTGKQDHESAQESRFEQPPKDVTVFLGYLSPVIDCLLWCKPAAPVCAGKAATVQHQHMQSSCPAHVCGPVSICLLHARVLKSFPWTGRLCSICLHSAFDAAIRPISISNQKALHFWHAMIPSGVLPGNCWQL